MRREQQGGERVPLVVVAGMQESHTSAVAEALRVEQPGTALVHHDLRRIDQGVVRRRVRHGERDSVTALELAHGCVSCTLREDLLPVLRQLAADPAVRRVVVRLDPALEPSAICWAIRHVVLEGPGDRHGPVGDDVRLVGVITTLDASTWLADTSGDEPLADRELAGSANDDRTVAQVAVGQVEFADAVVVGGSAPDATTAARTDAVLDRLAPAAPRTRLDVLAAGELLARVPSTSRLGHVEGPHGPLLRGQPPLHAEHGVTMVLFEARRPFHPERLHAALDALLEGVVRTRGRVWVASQPDSVLCLESAGGGLTVSHGGPWLAAVPAEDWGEADPEATLRAQLTWDDYYGDRAQELAVLVHDADPAEIRAALHGALVTDAELAGGEEFWRGLADPFGDWHEEPCADSEDGAAEEAVDPATPGTPPDVGRSGDPFAGSNTDDRRQG